jgi:potassium-transporting ATPase potassium-binding subunit
MTPASLGLVALYLIVLLLLVRPLGSYIAAVMEGRPIWPLRVGARLESLIYRACGVDSSSQMGWKRYMSALLVFNTLGALFLYALQRVQAWLPLNPQGFANVAPDSSFNTAISFVTNTNWQGYSGESTMSYLTQMAGLTVQNFLSAATGLVVAVALIRGFARHSVQAIGNFWTDMVRANLYILLPLSAVLALVLAGQGVVQNLSGYKDVTTLETTGAQTLPMGPMASQEAIKEIGTNGGGFLNANSAHPFENPTPLANFLEILALTLIPAALTYTFGSMVGDTRQGWAVLVTMLILFLTLVGTATWNEQVGNPRIAALGVDQSATPLQSGGNMEGKETRFGIAGSTLFATATTGTSCGAVNSMHESFTPLGGLVLLFNMQLGEVVFGGVGTGLYSMLVFAIIGVFIAGLMIGRTPEYLGKKIESFEIKMSAITILVMPFVVLLGTAVAVSTASGQAGVANPGAHGFSEILYAFTSAGNNNGSAFAGLSVNTPFYNTVLGLVMWLGRFWPIAAVLAIAGSLAEKKRVPATAGTMPTYGPTFIVLLIGTVLLLGALTFVPALALGPVVEHLMLWGA